MKKITAIILGLVLCFGVTMGCQKAETETDTGTGEAETTTDDGGGEATE